MMRGRGFRWRIVVTVVALVALTAGVLGVGAYGLVSASLRDRLVDEAVEQADFNVSVLAAERLGPDAGPAELEASGLIDAFRRRGAETAVEFGDGRLFVSRLELHAARDHLSRDLRAIVERGHRGYQALDLDGEPYVVAAARAPGTAHDFYFFFSARDVEEAIGELGRTLTGGALILVLIAVLAAGRVARGVLRPVRAASAAAERIAAGDLNARLAADGADEFGAWATSFNAMAASLEARIAELRAAHLQQRRFVSDVSHELRTPLTALVNEASLLRARLDAMDPDARRVAELLVSDVGRLRVLVGELMELSRLDAGAEQVEHEEIDVARFLEAVLASRLPTARLAVAPGIVLHSDRRRLERIVGNLVDNAREHGGGGEVVVTASRSGDRLVITVEDDGPGVAPADLPHLFDRFYKADPARPGGTGLGLAIAREHAAVLGGTLVASPGEGGGLRFQLRLPVTGSLPSRDPAVTAPSDAPVGRRPQHAALPTQRESRP